jgi:hypothetical protein
MATRAERALRVRVLAEAREAERLRRDAEELNRRIWRESALTEALMRRLRAGWFHPPEAGDGRDAEGHDHERR